jgi:hypothetical protein
MERLKEIKRELEGIESFPFAKINFVIDDERAEELIEEIEKIGKELLLINGSFLCDVDIDVLYYLSDFKFSDFYDFDEFENFVIECLENENAFNIEIIYYYKAMQFLTEHDQSLSESLEIASEYGYTTENLNSGLLASLLASRMARDSFQVNFEDEFNLIKECLELVEDLKGGE